MQLCNEWNQLRIQSRWRTRRKKLALNGSISFRRRSQSIRRHQACLAPHPACIVESKNGGSTWRITDGELSWNGNEGQIISPLDNAYTA
jgi:hypothetical protein